MPAMFAANLRLFLAIACVSVLWTHQAVAAGRLCSDLFRTASPVASDLKTRLDEMLTTFDTQLADRVVQFHDHVSERSEFSDGTFNKLTIAVVELRLADITPARFASFQNQVDAIFMKDPYFNNLQASYKLSGEDKNLKVLFVEQFADLIRDGFSIDIALIKLQTSFDRALPKTASQIAATISRLSDILYLVRTSSLYRFMGSNDTQGYFWQPLQTIDAVRNFRSHLLTQVRNRHGHRMAPFVIERLRLLVAQNDPDVGFLAKYAKFQNLTRTLSPTVPLAVLPAYETEFRRIRKKLGAAEDISATQLNQVLNRLWREEPYEMTLAFLFEEGPRRRDTLRDLTLMTDMLELSDSLQSSRAFGHYVRKLADQNARTEVNPVRPTAR